MINERSEENKISSYSVCDIILSAAFLVILAWLAISDRVPVFEIEAPPPAFLSLPAVWLVLYFINRR